MKMYLAIMAIRAAKEAVEETQSALRADARDYASKLLADIEKFEEILVREAGK